MVKKIDGFPRPNLFRSKAQSTQLERVNGGRAVQNVDPSNAEQVMDSRTFTPGAARDRDIDICERQLRQNRSNRGRGVHNQEPSWEGGNAGRTWSKFTIVFESAYEYSA